MSEEFERPPSTDDWTSVKRDVEESNRARDHYIPIIEKMDARVDEIYRMMARQIATVDKIAETILPIVTVHGIVLRFVRFWGGVFVGALVSVSVSVVAWYIIARLKG